LPVKKPLQPGGKRKLFPANQHLNQTKRTEAEKSILVLPIIMQTKTKGQNWKKLMF
jgi:hypothetical protein